ncbi:HAD-IIB family hydrolase [Actibacterium ureilyticum]|uniref:HAD-IIB family hydrolase n=1 Tax=Actibacterium ureilyticum TaxID=1590614 RepID=UPI000BAB1DA9|nr:HAD-IIB family hydrolase [Actibacterium ureilyticum]
MGLAVFTDLDGTLLDHDTYSYAAAQPALDRLITDRIPVILTSSKTAVEIIALHRDIGLGDAPIIVENGAGIVDPQQGNTDDDRAYRRIRAALDGLPGRADFRGFGDMTDAEVAEITGLPPQAAAMAQQRCHSEPGLWSGSDDALDTFLTALAERGISARRGGRFLTLSLGRTKADAMRDCAARLGATTTIALGDAPNDIEMLEAADFGVIIRNDHAPPLPPLRGEGTGRIRRTTAPGPQGWNVAMQDILNELAQA